MMDTDTKYSYRVAEVYEITDHTTRNIYTHR